MKQIISQLVESVETGTSPIGLATIDAALGASAFRVVAIKLLSWLQYRARSKKDQPLELHDQFPWCRHLRTAIAISIELSELFVIEKDALKFSSFVSESQRKEIEEFVGRHFQPPLMT
jgi:hypothetical protein